MQLILQTANVTADAKNCSYPNKVSFESEGRGYLNLYSP